MERLTALIASCVCLAVIGCGLGKTLVHGQMFIVTQGHESVKLGLVPVYLYQDDLVRKRAASRMALEADLSQAYYDAASAVEAAHSTLESTPEQMERARMIKDSPWAALSPFSTAETFLDSLPKPLARAKTDANGEFTIEVPRAGNYVLVAHTQRMAFGTTENYTWIVAIPNEALSGNKMLLSNDNLTTAKSPLSLLHTAE